MNPRAGGARVAGAIRALVLWAVAGLAAASPAVTAGADCAAPPLPRGGFAAAARRNAPAVVQVVVLRADRGTFDDSAGIDFFQPMQSASASGGDSVERTFSSGFFIDPGGLLLASAHAVFDAQAIWIAMADGRRLRAQVLGLDRRRDVALLKVDAADMPVVRIGSAAGPCPGSWVVAMGSPFGFDRTVTAGVVSTYPRYLHGSDIPLIQSDVVLNPGSSGGPLFDASGTLMGMSTMIYSSTGIFVGMSFALPVRELLRTAEVLRRGSASPPGEIGVGLQPLTPALARAFGTDGTEGALLMRVDPGGAGERAGLSVGDVVLGFAPGERLAPARIESRLAAAPPGSLLPLQVWRGGQVRTVAVQVEPAASAALPARQQANAGEARLGLSLVVIQARADIPAGVYVETATGSALLAGLERGDRIVAVNSIPVGDVDAFDAALAAAPSPDVVALLVGRGSAVLYIAVMRSAEAVTAR